MEERLQKILSQAGVASRRHAETLILEGRVTVNGATVTELGSKADLSRDHIKVDGRLLRPPRRNVYIALNKPNNTMTTVEDDRGRPTVMELLRGVKERVYPVGRLDYHSEGLLLFTNDGEVANAIMSAATHLPKTYGVKVNGSLTPEQEEKFRHGLPIEGRRTLAAGLKLVHRADNPWYEVRLFEGRKNQIRMMFKHFGLLVEKLKRVRIGPVELGSLKPGEFRYLTEEEVAKLKREIARAKRIGPAQAGPAPTAPAPTGPKRTGPKPTGPARTGPERTGPEPTGPGPTGPGPKRARPKPTGPKRAGPERTGPKPTGPRPTGPKRTGPKRTGPKRTGEGQ